MTAITKLADKDDKRVVINIVLMFKKKDEHWSIIKGRCKII